MMCLNREIGAKYQCNAIDLRQVSQADSYYTDVTSVARYACLLLWRPLAAFLVLTDQVPECNVLSLSLVRPCC